MFNCQELDISNLKLITPTVFGDHRGAFMETYHVDKFREMGITDNFVQDNQSRSAKGILRGFHLQRAPKAQSKLVRVIEGSIYDVAVDIDPNSPTFGKWSGVTLSADTPALFYIPGSCAHAFYVTSETAVVQYKCSDVYAPDLEVSIKWDDPTLSVDWPITTPPILSEKDQNALNWDAFVESL